jgi:hypothetical protein
MSQGWQGGSIAVYGGTSLYKVEAVTPASLLKRTNEDGRQGGREQDRKDAEKKEKKDFAGFLEGEYGKERSKNIKVQTNGYTKLGVPTAVFIKMRDYTYQN